MDGIQVGPGWQLGRSIGPTPPARERIVRRTIRVMARCDHEEYEDILDRLYWVYFDNTWILATKQCCSSLEAITWRPECCKAGAQTGLLTELFELKAGLAFNVMIETSIIDGGKGDKQ